MLWDHSGSDLEAFVRHLNQCDPHIQVDECSSSSSIRFLDLELFRDGSEIGYRVGFKPTDGHYVLPKDSHHPSSTHKAVIFSQILRWSSLSKHHSDFLNTCAEVFPLWRNQGVTRSSLRGALSRVQSITGLLTDWRPGFQPCRGQRCGSCEYADERSVFTANGVSYPILHRVSCSTQGCIYAIHCSRCLKFYIGQTCNTENIRTSKKVE